MERPATADEQACTAWWNALSDPERARWARLAGTGIAADAWRLYQASHKDPGYLIDFPGLAEVVARVPVTDKKHLPLVRALRTFDPLQQGYYPLESVKLVTFRDGELGTHKVLRDDGSVVHLDSRAWLAAQLDANGGDAYATYERLRGAGYFLSRCDVRKLFFTQDRHNDPFGPPQDFIQVEIEVHTEHVGWFLFDTHPFRAPRTLADLIDLRGRELDASIDGAQARQVGEARYHLRRVVDVAQWVAEAEALQVLKEHANREAIARVRKAVAARRDIEPSAQHEFALASESARPGFRRIFDDWANSSAGASGARLSSHWAMQLNDARDQRGERWMDLVPLWTHTRKMARISDATPGNYVLAGKLEALDLRVGVPFAWYFYMLHGNILGSWAGERMLKYAENGYTVMPEKDYRILKNWQRHPYGF